MQWKPEKYGGITSIRVPPNQVWTPDVNVFRYTFNRKLIINIFSGCFIQQC